jgi:ATP-dependent RNA helicase SUPV3L1/SUV3
VLAALELPSRDEETGEGLTEVEWAQAVSDAPHQAFAVSDDGRGIEYAGEQVARLRRGADLLHPEVHTGHLEVGAGVQKRVQRRVTAWLRDAVYELVGPAQALREGLSPAARGLAYQVVQGLGTVDAREAREQMRGLTAKDRATFEAAGIRVGHSGLHVPGSTRPESIRLRAALWSAFHEPEPRPVPPDPGRVSTRVDPDVERSFYLQVGYLVRGPMAIRFEQLERVMAELEGLAAPGVPFGLPPHLGSWLGCRSSQLPAVMTALGFSRVEKGKQRAGDRYARGNRPKRRRAQRM